MSLLQQQVGFKQSRKLFKICGPEDDLKTKHKPCNWLYSNRAVAVESPVSRWSYRVRLNVSWFVIQDEVLNFHDWILCYEEPSHDKLKR